MNFLLSVVVLLIILFQVNDLIADAFSIVSISSKDVPSRIFLLDKKDPLDVEFQRIDREESNDGLSPCTSTQLQSDIFQSPLQASLDMVDPQLRIPIEFTDPATKRFIPCNLAFVLEYDGIEYSIGSPIHTQVAVFCEGDNGLSYFVDPDVDDNLEIMEVAAERFESLNNCKLVFHRTPRTLTIQGNLDQLINGWDDTAKKMSPLDIDNIFDESEEDEFFDSFFKMELGENYREKYLVDDPELDKQVAELMDTFTFPGFGPRKNETEGIVEILKDIEKDAAIAEQDANTWVSDESTETETALRLVGFEGPDGKPYSLVKMLKPTILVAKEDKNLAPDQRLLLTKEEAMYIIPILENEFKNELASAGLTTTIKYQNTSNE
mmetsp:Transcript_5221/g.9949  ORF Transcript_5221/g.9949 Transcript_5221/m.9949 type:complete len:379 (-) Transcript_5221:65-1201(-)